MTRTTRLIPSLFIGLLAPALGCSSGADVNIGDTQSLGGKLSDYAATWDGYAEAYTFMPSGSDHIHLVLDAQGSGTVQVGTDALLPAPTDPNVGFPANSNVMSQGFKQPIAEGLTSGMLYPVYAAQVQADRIQVGLKSNDYYGAWCALQTPYLSLAGYMGGGTDGGLQPSYVYSPCPAEGGSSDDMGHCTVQINALDGSYTIQPIDCGKFNLCVQQVCTCSATSCIAAPAIASDAIAAAYPIELDAALDTSGKNMTGTLNIQGTRVTVHLQRQ